MLETGMTVATRHANEHQHSHPRIKFPLGSVRRVSAELAGRSDTDAKSAVIVTEQPETMRNFLPCERAI